MNLRKDSRYAEQGRTLAPELEAGRRRWLDAGLPRPTTLLVTGSGLDLDLGAPAAGPWPFDELLPFDVEAIDGHAATAELIETESGRLLAYCRGRIHAYQGYTPAEVVYLVRLFGLLGADTLVITNAAGSLDPLLRPGAIAAISDQLNLTGLNPLRGRLPPDWGPRFPDLADAYDPTLRRTFLELGRRLGMDIGEGVYLGLLGPSYETPAEIRAYRALGADLVGMSTVLEVIAARHLGLRVLGLSLITNMGVGMEDDPVNHEEVLDVGRDAAPRLARLLRALIASDALGQRKDVRRHV